MNELWKDVVYGWRILWGSPVFTLTAVLALALGIGANNAIFTVVNATLLAPLPLEDSERLVMVWAKTSEREQDTVTPANYLAIQRDSTVFESLAAFCYQELNLTGEDIPERFRAASVSANFFDVLGISSIVGGPELHREQEGVESRVVVISQRLYKRRYAEDPDIVGRQLRLNGESYTVSGVMAGDFLFPENVDLWVRAPRDIPVLQPQADPNDDLDSSYLRLLGRLEPGASLARAQAEMKRLAPRLEAEYPETNRGRWFEVVSLHEQVAGNVRTPLLVLLAAAGFVLLIACVNVANLLLARGSGRRREMSIRTALGAPRLRLMRQLLTESLVLALIAGALGLLLGVSAHRLLVVWLGGLGMPRLTEVAFDFAAVAFTFGISVATALLFGLLPAIKSSGTALRETIVTGDTRSSEGRGSQRFSDILVVAELAFVVVLLISAGLMIKTLKRLQQVDPGFEADRVLSARLVIPAQKYPEFPARRALMNQIRERLEALPDVDTAAAVWTPVMAGDDINIPFSIEGRTIEEEQDRPRDGFQVITDSYFEVMGIPILRGRDFDSRDHAEAPGAAILSEAMVERYWPDQDPLGRRITYDDPEDPECKWLTIVGIVGNVHHFGLSSGPRAEVYLPYSQATFPPFMYLALSSRERGVAAQTLIHAVRVEVSAVDDEMPLSAVVTVRQLVEDSLGQSRFTSRLLGAFASLALVLAAVGIFGVLAYTTSRRVREIGIRFALGAQRSQVLLQVIRRGLLVAGFGVVLGILGAMAATRMLQSLLFGVSSWDPMTFILTAVLLLGVAVLASLLPAYRASRVHPAMVLRGE